MESELDRCSKKAQQAGEDVAALDSPDAATSGVRDQLKALNDRVSKIKVKIEAYEEHYQDHLKQALEFQRAVRDLLDRIAARKAKLEKQVDPNDRRAILARIAELEVCMPTLRLGFHGIIAMTWCSFGPE